MGFRLVPISVTLNDPERRVVAVILRHFTELGSSGSRLRQSGWRLVYCLSLRR